MSGPVGNPNPAASAALQQAQATNLREFLPADLAGARGHEIHINSILVSDREIVSISHQQGSGLESIRLVTDSETITFAESTANGQYGVTVTIADDDSTDRYNMAASVVNGQLTLTNTGSGSLRGMTISPGFAALRISTSHGAVTASLR